MEAIEQNDLAELIRNNRLREELIPLKQLPDLIPSSRRGARLALPTIYRWILRGKLKSRKIGGSVYVTVQDLAEFVGGRQDGEPSAPRSPAAVTGAAHRAGQELDRLLCGGTKSGRRGHRTRTA